MQIHIRQCYKKITLCSKSMTKVGQNFVYPLLHLKFYVYAGKNVWTNSKGTPGNYS